MLSYAFKILTNLLLLFFLILFQVFFAFCLSSPCLFFRFYPVVNKISVKPRKIPFYVRPLLRRFKLRRRRGRENPGNEVGRTLRPFSSPEPLGLICNQDHVTKKRRALGTRMPCVILASYKHVNPSRMRNI